MRRTYVIDDVSNDIVKRVSNQFYDDNDSMAIRFIIKEWEYMSARFAALGNRVEPTEEERAKWDGAGGG